MASCSFSVSTSGPSGMALSWNREGRSYYRGRKKRPSGAGGAPEGRHEWGCRLARARRAVLPFDIDQAELVVPGRPADDIARPSRAHGVVQEFLGGLSIASPLDVHMQPHGGAVRDSEAPGIDIKFLAQEDVARFGLRGSPGTPVLVRHFSCAGEAAAVVEPEPTDSVCHNDSPWSFCCGSELIASIAKAEVVPSPLQ